MPSLPTPNDILTFFEERSGEYRYRDLFRHFDIQPHQRRDLKRILAAMVREDILRLRKGRWFRLGKGRIADSHTPELSAKTRRKQLFDRLFFEADWPLGFEPKVMAEVADLPETIDAVPEDAEDMRHIPFITIDPASAKDFDDAVAAEYIDNGQSIRLYVAIADVARYVRKNGAIDGSALSRATSVYVPGSVEPMLPEALSNGLCSLRPDENRMTMAAIIDYAPDGERQDMRFCSAMVRSRMRLSYEQAQKAIEGKLFDNEEVDHSFAAMKTLFRRLLDQRQSRGTLDFDLPEAVIEFDKAGDITGITQSIRLDAHRMIEEFMIAANVAVADFLFSKKFPVVYRIHEEPDRDKIQQFKILANSLGVRFPQFKSITAGTLNRFLMSLKEKEEFGYLNALLLRSLKQAIYSPNNKGHFGLSLHRYCHFTSPIRRYPDLEVHRLLKQALKNENDQEKRKSAAIGLTDVAQQCSNQERKAMEIERQAKSICQAEFMQYRTGEEFSGRITGVEKFGLFVQIADPYVEGMIHMSRLGSDYFLFDEERRQLFGEHTGKRYRLGDTLDVQLVSVDIAKGWIDFQPVGGDAENTRRRPPRQSRPAPRTKRRPPSRHRPTRRRRRR